jgi:hypothetical protein
MTRSPRVSPVDRIDTDVDVGESASASTICVPTITCTRRSPPSLFVANADADFTLPIGCGAVQLLTAADEGLVARPGGRAACGTASGTASRRLQCAPAE